MTLSCPVYRAEARACKRHPAFDAVVPDAQSFVTHVTTDALFLEMRRSVGNPHMAVTVCHHTNRKTMACAAIATQHISLPAGYAPTQGLLLHEIAHLCSAPSTGHDRLYAANYIRLVLHWLGEHAASVLLHELQTEDVL